MTDIRETASPEEWLRLYQAAEEFYQLQPWEWMEDERLFAVRDPASGEIGYCSILGNLGEFFALTVNLGREGLWGYEQILEGSFEEDPGVTILFQSMLMASFVDKDMLDEWELAQIKRLKRRYRKRSSWPQFQSYRPGYAPWRLEPAEVSFLTTALEQAVIVALRYRDDDDFFVENEEGEILCRTWDAVDREWRNEWIERDWEEPELPGELVVDADRLAALRELPRSRQGVELGYFAMPGSIQESEEDRPELPIAVLIVDERTEEPLTLEPAIYSDLKQRLVDVLLDQMEQAGSRFRRVCVDQDLAGDAIAGLLVTLDIKLRQFSHLDTLREASEMVGEVANDMLHGRFDGDFQKMLDQMIDEEFE